MGKEKKLHSGDPWDSRRLSGEFTPRKKKDISESQVQMVSEQNPTNPKATQYIITSLL